MVIEQIEPLLGSSTGEGVGWTTDANGAEENPPLPSARFQQNQNREYPRTLGVSASLTPLTANRQQTTGIGSRRSTLNVAVINWIRISPIWAAQRAFPWNLDDDDDDDDGNDGNDDGDGDDGDDDDDTGDGHGAGDDDWYHLLCQPLEWFMYLTPYKPYTVRR